MESEAEEDAQARKAAAIEKARALLSEAGAPLEQAMSRARNLAADVDAVAVGSDGSPTAAVSVRSRSATERVAVNRW